MNKKIRNYLLLVIVIFVSICIMLIIGNIYKYVNSRKENRSYIVNKVKSYDFENIVKGIDDVKNNGLLYISYIGNEKIYNFEKESYKILKNNNLISKFVYIDCTKDVNNGKVDNLNDKLNVITDQGIILPTIIYYKDGKPVDYIDSTNQVLTSDRLIQLIEKWEIDVND